MGAHHSSQLHLEGEEMRRRQTISHLSSLPAKRVGRDRAASLQSSALHYPTRFEVRQLMEQREQEKEEREEEVFHEEKKQEEKVHDEVMESRMEEKGRVRKMMSTDSDDSGIAQDPKESPGAFRRALRGRRWRVKREKEGKRRSRSLGEILHLSHTHGEKPASVFGASYLNREWEMVTVQEMCRRLSLDQDELEMPIPEGASTSTILDELMIRQIMEILPARAEGYPWVQIYNSEKNGFSLATLYRKMVEFDEDLSPVLLIIRDTKERVFGCVVSSAIRPNEHYYGTGDSCLLWRFTGEAPHTRELRHYNWTGNNQFFVNAAKDALSVGAGRGHYGLWLDADLNHGRSQRCDTFDNEPLCGDREDFIVQQLEAYGFRI